MTKAKIIMRQRCGAFMVVFSAYPRLSPNEIRAREGQPASGARADLEKAILHAD